jgi:ribosome-binding factor A
MLEHASGFIQRQIGRVLELRRLPSLRWIYDASAEEAADIDRIIREARERDKRINPGAE